MSGYFPARDASGEAWFRLGRLEVTTVIATVLIAVAGMIGWLIVPGLPSALAYAPDALARGELWRPFTWPLADTIGLWSILNLVLFWYFGRELEATVGRVRMAWLLVAIWASLTLTTTLVGLVTPSVAIAGMQLVEFCVVLLWIAEYPQRRFLFNIPAWVFGLFLLGLQAVGMIALRAWPSLIGLLLALLLVAVAARAVGLLGEYPWIPGRRMATRAPRPAAPPRAQRQQARRRASDEERMDELLAKISAEGIHALSRSERSELEKLRERRRRA